MTAASRLFDDEELWNQYIKCNLTRLEEDHVLLAEEIHGLPAVASGLGVAQGAGLHFEIVAMPEQISTDTPPQVFPVLFADWTFVKPFVRNPITWMGVQSSAGDGGGHAVARRIAGVSHTGCQLRAKVWAKSQHIIMYGVAQGLGADENGGGLTTQEGWWPPRTWADGEKPPYAWWDSEVRDDVEFIKRSHVELTNQVHGLAQSVHLLGHATGAGRHLEAQRYPEGDVGTQENGAAVAHTFTFEQAFTAVPVAVISGEFSTPDPKDTDYEAHLTAMAAGQLTANIGWGAAVDYYVNILALGVTA